MRYLDPKNDLVFKKIFGEHPHLLKSFLNALLPLKEGEFIEELEYLPPEQVPEIPELKNSIVDVKCRDNNGRQFIVEMQMLWTDSFKSRVLFNASKAFVRQLGKGRQYKILQPVYALSLVDDVFSEGQEKFYHHYAIVDTEDKKSKLDGLEFIFIELPKFKPQTITDKKMTALWLRFMTEIEDQQEGVSEDLLKNNEINEALEILRESAFTKAELEHYDMLWDSVSRERTLISEKTTQAELKGMERGIQKGIQRGIQRGIEEGMEKGIQKGIEEGMEKGMEKGIQKGMEKGIEEGVEKGVKKVAKNLLKSGVPYETIKEVTGLTKEQIEQLK